jgi:zinc transporter 2
MPQSLLEGTPTGTSSVGNPAMSANIVCSENPEYVLKKPTKLCREFGMYRSTIQIEQHDR